MQSNIQSNDPAVAAAVNELMAVLWKHGENAGKSKDTLNEYFYLLEGDLEIERLVEYFLNEF